MRRLPPLALGLALLCTTFPADAQDVLEDARERREAVQAEAAEAAGELDLLAAEDADIVAALAEVDAWMAIQQASLDASEQQLDTALEAETQARDRAAAMSAAIEALEAELTEQSITSYVGGFDQAVVLNTEDINDVPLIQFVIDEATGQTNDTAGLLRTARDQQERLSEEATEAAEQARSLGEDIEQRIDALEETRRTQLAIQAEIQTRVDALENESAALAEEDRLITEFIQAEEARRAEALRAQQEAAAEAQREAEQAAAEEAAREEAEEQPTPEPDQPDDPDQPDQPDAEPTPTEPPAPTPAPTAEPNPPATGGYLYPVGGSVGSGFGNRVHPVYGTVRFHAGLDFNSPNGSAIGATAAGTVIFAGAQGGYGNVVIVDHGGGITSLYAHMSGFAVSNGAQVSAGQVVGYVGSTGLSTGPHLHFEIRVNGVAVDPLGYL